MKRLLRNNSGFTLMELIISAGIIGLIGTVLVQGIMTAKSSTEITDVQEFMDVLTTEAVEAFKSDPTDLVSFVTTGSSPNPIPYPYDGMVYEIDTTTGLISFVNYYNEQLMDFNLNKTDPTVKYEARMKLTPTTPINPDTPFKFSTSKWKLNVKVSIKKGDSSKEFDEIYTKDYGFDNVAIKDIVQTPGVPGINSTIVKFHPNGGKVMDLNGGVENPLDKSVEREVTIGTSLALYVPVVKGQGDYAEEIYGWTTVKNDPTTQVDLTSLQISDTGPKEYYAYFLGKDTYALKFELEKSIQSFNSNINDSILNEDRTEHVSIAEVKNKPLTVSKVLGNSSEKMKLFPTPDGKYYPVNEKGKKFVDWVDKNGNVYRYNSDLPINPNHAVVLYPKMEKSEDIVKELNIDVTLDISENKNILSDLYNYHDANFELEYNESTDSFGVRMSRSTDELAAILGVENSYGNDILKGTYVHGNDNENGRTKIYFNGNENNTKLIQTYLKPEDKITYTNVLIKSVQLTVKYRDFNIDKFKIDTKDNASLYSPLNTSKGTLSLGNFVALFEDSNRLTMSFANKVIKNEDVLNKKIGEYIEGTSEVNLTSNATKVIKKGVNVEPILQTSTSSGGPIVNDDAVARKNVSISYIPTIAYTNNKSQQKINATYYIYQNSLDRLIFRLYIGHDRSFTNGIYDKGNNFIERDLGPATVQYKGNEKRIPVEVWEVNIHFNGLRNGTKFWGTVGRNITEKKPVGRDAINGPVDRGTRTYVPLGNYLGGISVLNDSAFNEKFPMTDGSNPRAMHIDKGEAGMWFSGVSDGGTSTVQKYVFVNESGVSMLPKGLR